MHIYRSQPMKKGLVLLLLAALLSTLWAGAGHRIQADTQPVFDIPALSEEHALSELPNVIVIGTGGTLAGQASNSDPTNFQSYRAGTFTIASLVEQLPRKDKIADVTTYQFGNKGSGGYTMKELFDLSLAVDQALEIYDSAVVTTGTDTMEEIAYFLDLTVRSEKPVVVTGAMRPWDVIGTDGPANLYNAIKLAGSGKTKWFGTVIMLNDEIHAAREVTKGNALRMDTFESPGLGVLGYVDSVVRIYRLTARALKAGTAAWSTPFDLRTITSDDLPLVGIIYNYQEASGGAIRGLVEDGVKGIVTAGTGAGGISSALGTARTAAIRDHGVVFLSTTRTGSGNVYGGSGNTIAGDNLKAQHGRIFLTLALAFTDQVNVIRYWMETTGTQALHMDDREAPSWAEADTLLLFTTVSDRITVVWPAAQDDKAVTRYLVYKDDSHVPIAALSGNTLTYTVSNLMPDTSYQLHVVAADAAGNESAVLSGSAVTAGEDPTDPTDPPVTTPVNPGTGTPGTPPVNVPAPVREVIAPGTAAAVTFGETLVLEVPAGASQQELIITVEQLLDTAGLNLSARTVLSPVYELLKNQSGNFAVPVKLSLRFDPSLLPAGQTPAIFYLDEERMEWIEVGGEVRGTTITVEVDHFTKFAVLGKIDSGGETPPVPSFSDVSGHWALAAIQEAAARGLVQGYPDGTFRPGRQVTRAEFTVMLMKALEKEASAPTGLTFRDRSTIGSWAAGAIAGAVEAGLVSGYPDNTFRPNETLTRAEMTVMLTRALGLTPPNSPTVYADQQLIPAWASPAVQAASAAGLVQGLPGNRFAPQQTATRAEAVTVLVNLLTRS